MMPTEVCYQHPDRLAVEHCEVCRRPVCGACLWYAESGERLCPAHAADWLQAGKSVHPPERYEEGIVHSQLSAARPAQPQIPYRGNSTDVTALVSAVSGVMALTACVGLSWAVPLVAFGLGLSSWLQAKDAINPQRTRTLAVVGMAGAGLLLIFFLVMMFFCLLGPMLLALTSRPGPISPPIATPFVFPTPTP